MGYLDLQLSKNRKPTTLEWLAVPVKIFFR